MACQLKVPAAVVVNEAEVTWPLAASGSGPLVKDGVPVQVLFGYRLKVTVPVGALPVTNAVSETAVPTGPPAEGVVKIWVLVGAGVGGGVMVTVSAPHVEVEVGLLVSPL